MHDHGNDLIGPSVTARTLGVNRSTVLRWAKSGRLSVVAYAGSKKAVRFDAAAVRALGRELAAERARVLEEQHAHLGERAS